MEGRSWARVGFVPSNRLSSVAAAARALKAFTPTEPTWGVAALAERLGLSTSSTHRILSTLRDEGLLEQLDATRAYRLSNTVFDLASAIPTHRTLHEAVLMPMTELRHLTNETVQAGVLDGRQVVYVERLDSPHTLRLFVQLGRRMDAHCTATGKVLLAHLPAPRRDRLLRDWELPRKTEHTITDHAALQSELASIRKNGFAENRHESEQGVVSVAAPLRDAGHNVVAALSVAGPSDRMDDARRDIIHHVRRLAATASRQLKFDSR